MQAAAHDNGERETNKGTDERAYAADTNKRAAPSVDGRGGAPDAREDVDDAGNAEAERRDQCASEAAKPLGNVDPCNERGDEEERGDKEECGVPAALIGLAESRDEHREYRCRKGGGAGGWRLDAHMRTIAPRCESRGGRVCLREGGVARSHL